MWPRAAMYVMQIARRATPATFPAPRRTCHSQPQFDPDIQREVHDALQLARPDKVEELLVRRVQALVTKARTRAEAQQEKAQLLHQAELETARLRLQGAQLRLELAQLRLEAAKEQGKAKLDLMTAKYMMLTGTLNMRGLIEYGEKVLMSELLLDGKMLGPSRKKNWETILAADEHQELLRCLQACVPANKRKHDHLAQRFCSMYKHLSGIYTQHSAIAVDIVEGPYSREEAAMLQCLAKRLDVPYRLWPKDNSSSLDLEDDEASDKAPEDCHAAGRTGNAKDGQASGG